MMPARQVGDVDSKSYWVTFLFTFHNICTSKFLDVTPMAAMMTNNFLLKVNEKAVIAKKISSLIFPQKILINQITNSTLLWDIGFTFLEGRYVISQNQSYLTKY